MATNLEVAKIEYEEYLNTFASGDMEGLPAAEERFKTIAAKMTDAERKALAQYFMSLLKSERPENIALDYRY